MSDATQEQDDTSAAEPPAVAPSASPTPTRPPGLRSALTGTVAGRAFLLFLVSLVVRLATIAVLDPDRRPAGDEDDYAFLAERLADGWGFTEWDQIPWPGSTLSTILEGGSRVPTAFRPPLFPLVLAPYQWAMESLPGTTLAHLRIVNLVLGSLCAPLAYMALRRSPLRDRAIVPAAALAVWPPAVFLSAQLLAEPLAMSLSLASIALLPSTDDDRVRRPFLAGLLSGLAVLARPASLLSGAFIGLVQGRVRRVAWFALAAALAIAPWVVRNHLTQGRPLLTTNSGVTLVGANNWYALDQEWPGKWMDPSDVYAGQSRYDPKPFRGDGVGWSEAEHDRACAADAWDWVSENPGAYVTLCAFKLVRLFDPDQHSNKPDARAKAIIGWVTYLPVLLLAIVGARIAWRDRRAWAPWFALCGGVVATTLIFYGDVRMRSPMDPALLAFATLAAGSAIDRFRSRAPWGG